LTSVSLEFENNDLLPALFGESNEHLKTLEERLGVVISGRGNLLHLQGPKDAVASAETVLSTLWDKLQSRHDVGHAEIEAALRFVESAAERQNEGAANGKASLDNIKKAIKTKKKTISPRSPTQAEYVRAIESHEMVFGLGPAGTGKTYLAVAMAVQAYIRGDVEKLIFCRPALEAGERIGFLPGDMKEKVDPYLRPIYDALNDMMPYDVIQKKTDAGDIEIAPLAFMRGRTLGNAFVILDEAQNATPSQMKMFLTRMGEGARFIVTGDPTQSDLPKGENSGLADALRILQNVAGIQFIHFTAEDVVRHALVHKIVNAYEADHKSS